MIKIKKPVIMLALVGATVLTVELVINYVMDPHKYTDKISNYIEHETGYKVKFIGNLDLDLLPSPAINIDELVINDNVSVKNIGIGFSWHSLYTTPEIKNITLDGLKGSFKDKNIDFNVSDVRMNGEILFNDDSVDIKSMYIETPFVDMQTSAQITNKNTDGIIQLSNYNSEEFNKEIHGINKTTIDGFITSVNNQPSYKLNAGVFTIGNQNFKVK